MRQILAPLPIKSAYLSTSENLSSSRNFKNHNNQLKMKLTQIFGIATIVLATVNGMTTQNYREYCNLTTSQGRRVCKLCTNNMIFQAVPIRIKHTCGVLVKAGCCQMLTNMF